MCTKLYRCGKFCMVNVKGGKCPNLGNLDVTVSVRYTNVPPCTMSRDMH